MFSLRNKRINALALGCMLATIVPMQLFGADKALATTDHQAAPIMSTLQECIDQKLVTRELKDLKAFAQTLNDQDEFIQYCADSLAMHKKFLNKEDWINKKNRIHEKFDALSNTEQTVHAFKISSNNAIAWALRYRTIGTLIHPDTSDEQYNTVKAILDLWRNTDDDEIQSLITLYSQKLEVIDCIRKNIIAQKAMNKYILHFCDLVKIRPSLRSHNSPFTYSRLLAIPVCTVFKKSLNVSLDQATQLTQEEYNSIASIIGRYKAESDRFTRLQQQIQQIITALSAPANKDEWLPDHFKQTDKKKKSPVQTTKKKKRSRNKGKGKYIERDANTFDQASSSSSSDSSDPDITTIESVTKSATLTYPTRIAADGSATLLEDDTKVVITDQKNNVTLTLWKVEEPQQTYSNPRYTAWVHAWFDDAEQAMEEQGYNNPDSAKYHLRDSAKLVHSFARAADDYLNQCGTISKVYNKQGKLHLAISIPGYITYSNSTEQHGLFTYFIDTENGQWYHRNFTKKTPEQLYAEYMNAGLYEVAFPELE